MLFHWKVLIGLLFLPERGQIPLGCSQGRWRHLLFQTKEFPFLCSRGFRQKSLTLCSQVLHLCTYSKGPRRWPPLLRSTTAMQLRHPTPKPTIQQVTGFFSRKNPMIMVFLVEFIVNGNMKITFKTAEEGVLQHFCLKPITQFGKDEWNGHFCRRLWVQSDTTFSYLKHVFFLLDLVKLFGS